MTYSPGVLCLGQEIQKLPFCTKSAPRLCLPVLLSLYFPSVLQEYLKPSLEHSTGGLHAEWVWDSVFSCFASCMQWGKASRTRWAGAAQEMGSLGSCCPSGTRLEWVSRTSPGFALGCSCLWPAWSQVQLIRDFRSKGRHRILPVGRPREPWDAVSLVLMGETLRVLLEALKVRITPHGSVSPVWNECGELTGDARYIWDCMMLLVCSTGEPLGNTAEKI